MQNKNIFDNNYIKNANYSFIYIEEDCFGGYFVSLISLDQSYSFEKNDLVGPEQLDHVVPKELEKETEIVQSR